MPKNGIVAPNRTMLATRVDPNSLATLSTFNKMCIRDRYLALMEEAKKRDHRKIGKEMQLFMFSDTVGKGLPMWLPKGTALRLRLQDFLRRIQTRYDYQEVITPPIGNKLLYVTSGHYAKYGKDCLLYTSRCV